MPPFQLAGKDRADNDIIYNRYSYRQSWSYESTDAGSTGNPVKRNSTFGHPIDALRMHLQTQRNPLTAPRPHHRSDFRHDSCAHRLSDFRQESARRSKDRRYAYRSIHRRNHQSCRTQDNAGSQRRDIYSDQFIRHPGELSISRIPACNRNKTFQKIPPEQHKYIYRKGRGNHSKGNEQGRQEASQGIPDPHRYRLHSKAARRDDPYCRNICRRSSSPAGVDVHDYLHPYAHHSRNRMFVHKEDTQHEIQLRHRHVFHLHILPYSGLDGRFQQTEPHWRARTYGLSAHRRFRFASVTGDIREDFPHRLGYDGNRIRDIHKLPSFRTYDGCCDEKQGCTHSWPHNRSTRLCCRQLSRLPYVAAARPAIEKV